MDCNWEFMFLHRDKVFMPVGITRPQCSLGLNFVPNKKREMSIMVKNKYLKISLSKKKYLKNIYSSTYKMKIHPLHLKQIK